MSSRGSSVRSQVATPSRSVPLAIAEPPDRGRVARVLARLGTPATIARLVWLVGVVSLLSAASPAFHSRVRIVTQIVPQFFPAAATTGTLAAGVVLMLLANGLR